MNRSIKFAASVLVCSLLLIVSCNSTYSTIWPMKNSEGNFNGPLRVSSTLGDYRYTSDENLHRFHHGIDIGGTGAVYSIESGIASVGTNSVSVGNYRYVHLKNKIQNRSPVVGIIDDPINPTKIGEVDGDHLHFQAGTGPWFNPLGYNGGLNGFTDNTSPKVYTIDFFPDGSEIEGTSLLMSLQKLIFDKIDIRANCQDFRSFNNVNYSSGIYRLEYIIQDSNDDTFYGPI